MVRACTEKRRRIRTAGLDIGYVPAGPDAFFRWSGQFGPQQLIFYWPAGPVVFWGASKFFGGPVSFQIYWPPGPLDPQAQCQGLRRQESDGDGGAGEKKERKTKAEVVG